jgi:hypothetical protein
MTKIFPNLDFLTNLGSKPQLHPEMNAAVSDGERESRQTRSVSSLLALLPHLPVHRALQLVAPLLRRTGTQVGRHCVVHLGVYISDLTEVCVCVCTFVCVCTSVCTCMYV